MRIIIGQVVGRYRIEAMLEQGGVGVVYKAHVSIAKTLSTVENALTLQCERRTRYANRVRKGRPTTRQLKQHPVIQADIYIKDGF